MERLQKTGTILPVTAAELKESRLGLGMEKLDRDAFEPEKVYDKVAALGVKWIRLQSGWQKTEQQPGVYDFAWLDAQVDALRQRGLTPWLCLCYGNQLYDPLATQYQGAVGCPPIRTRQAYEAWLRYVTATAAHFAGRVEYYEIWNEPEGCWTWRPQPRPEEYADFCVQTAGAVHAGDAGAKIITGSHYEDTLQSFAAEFAAGSLSVSDAITFHSYQYDERKSIHKAKAFRHLARKMGKPVEVIQGESGSQSQSGGNGALNWVRTDGEMQTKQLLRHTVADLISDVKFTSVFSCVDMAENLDAASDKPITTCGYFGVLGAQFDPKTGKLVGNYFEKPSYYAYRNICAMFGGDIRVEELPVLFCPTASTRVDGLDCPTDRLVYGGFTRQDGSAAFAYWNATDLVTVKGYDGSVSLELYASGDIRLVDPMDGAVYELPDECMIREPYGLIRLQHIPVRDYPLVLLIGDFAKIDRQE